MLNKFGRNKKIIISVIFIALFSSAFIFNRAFSYDSDIAHPNIAVLAAELYNQNTKQQLTKEEIDWIRQGAFDEDKPIRWMNHFYDPINNRGVYYVWQYQMSSKKWAQSSSFQEVYTLGDFSWQRAIYDYQHGNKEQALIGLGHILHLISDASVPAHTRNNPHEFGDSYEQFVKYNWDILLKGLEKVEKPIMYFDNLDDYFDSMAGYTNKNFYSDGTLDDKNYAEIPFESYEKINDGTRAIFKSQDGINIYIKKNEDKNWKSKVIKLFSFNSKKIIKDPLILTSYTKHLLPKAIGHSAGIIDLFFKEVEKEQDFSSFNFGKYREKWLNTEHAMNYLAGVTMDKIIDFKNRNNIGPFNVVYADKNTVLKIMSDEPVIDEPLDDDQDKEDAEEKPLPNPPPDVKPGQALVGEGNEIVTSPNPSLEKEGDEDDEPLPSPLLVGEETGLQGDLSTPMVTEGREKPSGEFSFVFGAGGELSGPLPNPPLQGEGNDDETATTTEDIVDDGPHLNPPLVGEEDEEEDTVPPNVNLSLSNLQISTSTTSTIDISWSSDASDLAYYNIEYKTTGLLRPVGLVMTGEDESQILPMTGGDWVEFVTSTTSTAKTINVQNYQTYSFRVNAIDINDNTSDWTQKSITVDWSKSVVINEVAWMGTASYQSNDEWIELYNNTDTDIDLAGWSLTVSGKKINWYHHQQAGLSAQAGSTSSTIPAHGYYLLERTDDKTLSLPADAFFSISYGLKNNGEDLILLNNNGEIIDQVDASERWFAGENSGKYRTMGRINSNAPGSLASNWQTTMFFTYKGRGDSVQYIFGSPKQPNIGYQYLNQIKSTYDWDDENTLILSKENSPYIYTTLDVPVGYTVKVEAGAVLVGAGDETYINVSGVFIVEGSADDPVIFTSRKDINNFDCENANFLFGLERNCQADESLPGEAQGAKSGDWSRIAIKEGGKFTANNTKFLYGGRKYYQYGFNGKFPSRIIDNIGGEVNISDSSFEYSYTNVNETLRYYDAIVYTVGNTQNSATTTLNNIIFDTGHRAVANDSAYTKISIKNSEFKNFSSVEGPFFFKNTLPELDNITFTSNTSDVIYLYGLVVDGDRTLKANNEYNISNLIINTSSTLDIEEGVVINMWDRGIIRVDGGLNINGTAEHPVNILPLIQGNKWGGIVFNNSTSTISYTNLDKGGLDTVYKDREGGVIVLNNSNVKLNNVELTNARRPFNMLHSTDSHLSLRDSLISWDGPMSNNNWYIRGVVLNGGHLNLDNTYFNEMGGALVGSNGATVEVENMTLGHFTNIKDYWSPVDLINIL
ncbi:MAG: lamin tail domain-containing protein [bacterium]|nr:lamin tail domain-containing protein [bacterium]